MGAEHVHGSVSVLVSNGELELCIEILYIYSGVSSYAILWHWGCILSFDCSSKK